MRQRSLPQVKPANRIKLKLVKCFYLDRDNNNISQVDFNSQTNLKMNLDSKLQKRHLIHRNLNKWKTPKTCREVLSPILLNKTLDLAQRLGLMRIETYSHCDKSILMLCLTNSDRNKIEKAQKLWKHSKSDE